MNESRQSDEFDFGAHARKVVEQYRTIRPDYELLAEVTKRLLIEMLRASGIRPHSVEARAKSLESFEMKVAMPSEADPRKPKYIAPLREITDLAGVRVITFLPRTVDQVCALIDREFTVKERTDKSVELLDKGKLGYQSIHFLVEMHPNRVRLPEYQRHRGLTFEVQVRTLLQHAWAEMEHDIQYKTAAVLPAAIRKKFIALAGLLEIADREFQSLQDEDERLREKARQSIRAGELTKVEITPDALKSYLDRKLGSDGRMTQFSYEWIVRVLRKLGFETLSQIEECIASYDDDKVSRAVWGTRQGQLSRFEDTVLASMGAAFIDRHLWSREPDWAKRLEERLTRLTKNGVKVGAYVPTPKLAQDD
mgnify:CR=1 FL=1